MVAWCDIACHVGGPYNRKKERKNIWVKDIKKFYINILFLLHGWFWILFSIYDQNLIFMNWFLKGVNNFFEKVLYIDVCKYIFFLVLLKSYFIKGLWVIKTIY